jgi:hypothetical protein
MFQSALPYLQREFIEAAIHPTNAATLPEVLIVYKQSNRACRFLQQSFSGGLAVATAPVFSLNGSCFSVCPDRFFPAV